MAYRAVSVVNLKGKRRKFGKEAQMTGCIVGWAHSKFGKLDGESVESLIVQVANGALADAGVAARDVDEIVLGHFNAGFSEQDFTASLVLQASP
jgi:acetyl-CoA C-acetyltransferase